jgi:hypothetical protein
MLPDLLKLVICSATQDQHVCKDPIALSCAHCICRDCIPADPNAQLNCNKCGSLNQNNLQESTVSLATQNLIRENMNELLAFIKQDLRNTFEELRGKIEKKVL